MKLNYRNSKPSEQGGVLVATLVITLLLGVTIGSYLTMISSQNRTMARSQAWNSALAMSEAGVEEALAQLNPGATTLTVDRTANGWGAANGGVYGPKSSALSGGSYKVVYTDTTFPVIYSTGYVTIPTITATVTRTIRVATTNVPMFGVAMAAQGNIDFKGSGVATDSFDSSNTNSSTGGRYDSSKASTNGSIASMAGVINVGVGTVNGQVLLGPTATDDIKKGTVTGGVVDDFNYEFQDVVVPDPLKSAVPPVANNQTVGGVNYKYAFTNSGNFDYQMASFNGGSIYVGNGAHVRLYITGGASIDTIKVNMDAINSGSLTIYMAGANFTVGVMDGGYAANLSYYGLPSNTSISMTGNASFTGTIYAPEADIKMGGGGSDTYDFVGSCVVHSITMNGHFKFHYDEALARSGPTRGYTACLWQEI